MFSKKFENKFTWEWYEKVKGNGAYVCIFWVHFNSFKIFSSEQSLYSALNILLLDLKSVKCVCIETAQTWTYFTYFTYFIYIDIQNRTLGIVWIDIQILFSFICWRKGTCNNWQWIIQNIISEYIEKRIICHSETCAGK